MVGYQYTLCIAQSDICFFVTFIDKKGTPHQINHPELFLSQRAIQRRSNQGIKIDSTDLGVSETYINKLKKLNVNIINTSKWLNGAIIKCNDLNLIDTIKQLHFIKTVSLNKGFITTDNTPKFDKLTTLKTSEHNKSLIYGDAYDQISTVNGTSLHNFGFLGEGKHIAIIDAGFYGVNYLPCFQNLFKNNQILGTKDFVDPNSNIYTTHPHGMHVLSIIGGNISGSYLGTAPKASFWLLRTEDATSEFPIEGDYWVCAAEFADSVGVDIINSSLGYTTFDNEELNFLPSQLDGTSRISKAANIAVSKGMVVVVSAGNEGNSDWQYISTPSDAPDVLCIGAMTKDSLLASFSSIGNPYINQIKPDVICMGVYNAVQDMDGTIKRGHGTSYAAPVISGLAACLWESLPSSNSYNIINTIRKSGSKYSNPNKYYGYGIPNFAKDLHKNSNVEIKAWTDPNGYITIFLKNHTKPYTVQLINISGNCLMKFKSSESTICIKQSIPKGVYIIQLFNDKFNISKKIIKP